MKKFIFLFISLNSLVFAESEKKPNVLLICIDDLRPELPSFGKDYIHAPNIEKLSKEGRLFKRHYVQAPTCGASRYALLTGKYPKGKLLNNNAITKHDHENEPSFPAYLRRNGYKTVALGKISHYPGGHSGENWNDKSKPEMPGAWDALPECFGIWKHPKGQMHGYANGIGRIPGKSPRLEALDGPYPDDPTVDTFKREIAALADQEKPWLCAVGLLRPHLPFACPKKYLDLYKTEDLPEIPAYQRPPKGEFWHGSGEFNGNYSNPKDPNKDLAYAKEVLRHYAACVSYADHSVGEILKGLEATGQADNTIVILWGDHGWHLGEQHIWGKHSPYAVALHSPLIIKIPHQKAPGTPSEEVVETLDLYPTLCEALDLPIPQHIEGKSIYAIAKDPKHKSDGLAISYWRNFRSEITATNHDMIDIKTEKVSQKYKLDTDPHEQRNLIKK